MPILGVIASKRLPNTAYIQTTYHENYFVGQDSNGDLWSAGISTPSGANGAYAVKLPTSFSGLTVSNTTVDQNTAGATNTKFLSGGIDNIGGGMVTGGYMKTTGAVLKPLVCKLSSTGTLTWGRTPVASTGFWVAHTGAASSATGAVATTGQIANASGGYVAIILYYNSSGVLQWQRTYTDANTAATTNSAGNASTVDSADNVYVVGFYKTGTTTGQGGLVLKYNSAGTLQWAQVQTDGNGSSSSYIENRAVTVDASGNVYTAGFTRDTGSTSIYFFFITKYNSTGTLQWAKKISTSSSAYYFSDIAVDTSGNVYCGGQYGTNQICIAKLDSAGNFTAGRIITGSGTNVSNFTMGQSAGNRIAINNTTGQMWLGPTLLNVTSANTSAVIISTTTSLPVVGTVYGSSTGNGAMTVSDWAGSTATWGGTSSTLGTNATSTLITDAAAALTVTTSSTNNTLAVTY